MNKGKGTYNKTSSVAGTIVTHREGRGRRAGEGKQAWRTYDMSTIIRFCGQLGFGHYKTTKIMTALRLNPLPITIKIKLSEGRLGKENIAVLNQHARADFDAIADAIPNDEKRSHGGRPKKIKKRKWGKHKRIRG